MVKYTINDNNLHIIESAFVPKGRFSRELVSISNLHSNKEVIKNRSIKSMKLEWATHNFLYACHIKRSSTKDVDLNYPQKLWERIVYPVCGVLVWIFIK